MIAVIDNYDSFVYNLVQYVEELGCSTAVFRNDQVTAADIKAQNPRALIISPGPCSPDQAGISIEAVKTFAGSIPILGVCLGHQAIAQAFGGQVVQASALMHGKRSRIYHDGDTIFSSIENPFPATRYHSLVVERASLPECLRVSAWTEDNTVMGIRHNRFAVEGVQFHPESILTSSGKHVLQNFLYYAGEQ